MEEGYGHKVLRIAEDLLVDGYSYKPSNFSSRMCHLRGHLSSLRHPSTHIHTGGAEWTQWFKKNCKRKEKVKLKGKSVSIMGEKRGKRIRVNLIKTHCVCI